MLVVLGSLSKSSVLVRSSIGPFRSFLYFGILLTETAATSERLAQRGALERPRWLHLQPEDLDVVTPPVTAERENELPPFVGDPFFFMHALPLFLVRGLWEFLHILIIFFFNLV